MLLHIGIDVPDEWVFGCQGASEGLRPSQLPTTTFDGPKRTYFFKKSKTNFSKAAFRFYGPLVELVLLASWFVQDHFSVFLTDFYVTPIYRGNNLYCKKDSNATKQKSPLGSRKNASLKRAALYNQKTTGLQRPIVDFIIWIFFQICIQKAQAVISVLTQSL